MALFVFFMAYLCRPVLREVPGLGRSVGRAAVVVRSVKLVHQGRAMRGWHVLLANAPRFRSASIVLSTILRQRGAAISQHVSARCWLDHTMVHLAPPLFVETALCLPLQQPMAPAREVAHCPLMQRRKRVRPDSNDRVGWELQPTLEDASAARSTSQVAEL